LSQDLPAPPHSSDDDDRTTHAQEAEAEPRDPIKRYEAYLKNKGLLTDAMVEEYEARARQEVDEAQAFAEQAPYPPAENALGPVFAPSE
jgi:TPP-dependent pyruvate/acetoin dehydrogenase alpha subunit